jgi:hypothetical protein
MKMASNTTKVNVNFAVAPPEPNHDPVIVNKNQQDGVQWTANQVGYTFTALEIGNALVTGSGVGDFKNVVISQTPGANPRSEMAVDDACTIPGGAESVDYKYTLHYTDPNGAPQTIDPTIRNKM